MNYKRCVMLILLCSSASVFWLASGLAQQNGQQRSPEFKRFQNGGALQVDTDKLPTKWSPERNIVWKSKIPGYGQSTPVVLGNLLVLTATSGEKKETCHVVAYQAQTGKKAWQLDFQNPTPYPNTPMVSRAAPSCVAIKNSVIAFFEGGLLAGIDISGKVIWERNLVEEFGGIDARHGIAASLESEGDKVFAWVERSEKPYIIAVNPLNGESYWKVDGVGATSWSSPRIVPVEGGRHLVCSAIGNIIGLDPKNGERLWEFDGISNNSSNTPMPVGIGKFLIGASEGRGEGSSGKAADNNGLIEIQKDQSNQWSASFKWRAKKASSSFGSPVIAGGTAAFVNRAGVLYRLDLETGEQKYVSRTSAGGIWATPIVVGDRLYLFGRGGTTSVLSMTTGEELSTNRCWAKSSEDANAGFGEGRVLYSALIVGEKIILRSGDMLYAVEG